MPEDSNDALADGRSVGRGAGGKNSIDTSIDSVSSKKSCPGVDSCDSSNVHDGKDGGVVSSDVSSSSSVVGDKSVPRAEPCSSDDKGASLENDGKSVVGDRRGPSVNAAHARRLVTDTANLDIDRFVDAMGSQQAGTRSDSEESMQMNETNRMLRELTADSELMNQVMRAATNPEMAKELARQADTAWRNIEALPGGFRALCQMHRSIQQPLWQAMTKDNRKVSMTLKGYDRLVTPKPNELLNVEAFPNPWATPQSTYPSVPNSGASGMAMNASLAHLSNFFNSSALTGQPRVSASVGSEGANSVSSHSRFSCQGTESSSGASGNTSIEEPVASKSASSDPDDAPSISLPSDVRYAHELQQMLDMGLEDRDLCITVLEASDGDLVAAIDLFQSLSEPDSGKGNQG
ncbi:hypothetical protein BBOV_III005480 [Babesia bovis T2Bo]|uniref:UBA domain-containing protein n=1 Tax=Babesia bovis TaxID=5865 RepID=A7ANH7_BABBO|nr:hypothetical protein BBOV_III005480 [Babesia bovis T2Bo]EDO08111.1 hypothetical protein BBOV_III005480 [Babesia bovis T2Bo]|eukprot:XP_001611679.1 hypothetical protein [Babesia bovis T2Bo]